MDAAGEVSTVSINGLETRFNLTPGEFSLGSWTPSTDAAGEASTVSINGLETRSNVTPGNFLLVPELD